MAVEGLGGQSNGIAFLVSAGVVYEIMAACASSPQTVQINAGARAETLMFWVHTGVAQAAVFVAAAAYVDRKHTRPILAGAILAAVILECSYLYAKREGLRARGPSTETYNTPAWSAA